MEKKVNIFRPGISELQEIAQQYKDIKIKGIDDTEGYERAKEAKKHLTSTRTSIAKYGKSKREEAIRWQKEVLRQEKEHIAVIEPVEKQLKEQLEEIDRQKKREKRKVLLPARKKMLESINCNISDEELLDMDENTYSQFYTEQRQLYDQEQERIAEEKRRQEEIERAKKEAAEQARKEAKERAEREKAEAIERERRRIQEEQERKEREKREKEEEQQRQKEEEARRIQERKEKKQRRKKYQDWLKKHGYKDDGTFVIDQEGDTFIMYKKVSQITL